MSKNRGLGKGLGALLPELEDDHLSAQTAIRIHLIVPNPYQPRKDFSDEKLTELAESIKTHGIIQPLLVRERDGRYQLIAGERRLRAAKLAGLNEVPVVIKDLSDQSMMEIALVENLQRENLNPIEEAEAYQRLMNEFRLTQDELAQKVGKSRSAVANMLRLLNLPTELQRDLSGGVLTMGHARALLGLTSADVQKAIWQQIQQQQLSVRETEELIRKLNTPGTSEPPVSVVSRETKKKETIGFERDPNVVMAEEELQQALGTKVHVKANGPVGRIEIEYYSPEEFERIFEKITGY